MMVFSISSFNRNFGSNPLQTLTKMKNECIENGNPELTREQREKLINSFSSMQRYYEELGKRNEILDNSIEDKLRKNELPESEVKSLFKWMDENTQPALLMQVDGISYDEACIEVFHTSKSIDEFKTKYLELQKKYSVDFSKKINNSQKAQIAEQNSNSIQKSNESTQNPENKKPFKPIQGESKNKETYKDNNISHEFLKKLLKNSFNKAKELEILLGMKMSDEEGELNSFLLKKNLQSVKGVDIKV